MKDVRGTKLKISDRVCIQENIATVNGMLYENTIVKVDSLEVLSLGDFSLELHHCNSVLNLSVAHVDMRGLPSNRTEMLYEIL